MTHFIRVTSDIHNEFCSLNQLNEHFRYVLPPLQTDSFSVLVVAGDFCNFIRPYSYMEFINHVKFRFSDIVIVPGNHEWYGTEYPDGEKEFKEFIAPFKNIHYLSGTEGNKSTVTIGDVQFIGNTLWTDFNKADPRTMAEGKRFMNDYNLIELSSHMYKSAIARKMLEPENLLDAHKSDLHKIEYHLKRKPNLKKVVVTHHGPTMKHIHPKYALAGLSNYSFTSDLEDFILKYQPKYWISGHTHESIDVTIGETRCVVNPAGYKNRYVSVYENQTYNPELVLEI